MAWGETKELKFDVGEISRMRTKLQDTSQELKTEKTNLLKEMTSLRENWKTPAGKKFLKDFDDSWVNNIDKYVTIIDAVDELLEVAYNAYQEVEAAAKKVTF